MDRFIVSLPKFVVNSSSVHKSKGEKRKFEEKKETESKSKRTQMYLDLGQKSFAATTQCENCNLLFRTNDLDDIKQHRQYCKDHSNLPTISISSSQGLNILREFPENKDKVLFLRRQEYYTTQRKSANHEDTKLERCNDNKRCKLLLQRLVAQMKEDFGEAIEDLDLNRLDLYLYVQDRTVIGAVIIDQITPSIRIQLINSMEDLSVVDSVDQGEISQKCFVGIRYLWVHRSARRRRVAFKLIEEVRKNHIFGLEIHREEIAFTQLTEDGLAFAQKYCGQKIIPCYNPPI